MNNLKNLLTTFSVICILTSYGFTKESSIECNEQTMDAFAYEDCISEFKNQNKDSIKIIKNDVYSPFNKDAYLTSSFGENRGTRYHAGIDYSTEMEEGLAIFAPEDGRVTEIRTSPFGYGKVMYYKGNSGKTWVFAHQSSFGWLDEDVSKKQYALKKNDVTIYPNKTFKKGDTLTFSGSSGIGNPHLHLEVRLDNDKIINPCKIGVLCKDTIAPQIFGVAVWQGNELATTNKEAFLKGCAVTPVKNEFSLNMAIKIADYSRIPKDNPMAVRRIEVWRYDEKIYSKILDTLSYKKMLNIRDELLWAEEADTAGDWHYINAKIAPLSSYKIEIEDFAGNITTNKFTLHPKCKLNTPIDLVKNQTSPLFTFLSKPMLDLFRCESGYKFKAFGTKDTILSDNLCKDFEHKATLLAKIAETYPDIKNIQYTANSNSTGNGKALDELIAIYPYKKNKTHINWNTKMGEIGISQKISLIPMANDTSIKILAFTKTHTDSLDFFEFHPKGLQFKGKWDICIENPTNNAPLYWLGETSRDWFIFSKQTGSKKRCTSLNELRDIANIQTEETPILGFPYWANSYVNGLNQSVLKIPIIFKYNGIIDGNSITVKAKNKWISAEYDSEPREIILFGESLPESGESISIQIIDEAKRKSNFDVQIPGM